MTARHFCCLRGAVGLLQHANDRTHQQKLLNLQEEYFMKKIIKKITHTAKSAVTCVKTAAVNSMSAVLAFNRRAV